MGEDVDQFIKKLKNLIHSIKQSYEREEMVPTILKMRDSQTKKALSRYSVIIRKWSALQKGKEGGVQQNRQIEWSENELIILLFSIFFYWLPRIDKATLRK